MKMKTMNRLSLDDYYSETVDDVRWVGKYELSDLSSLGNNILDDRDKKCEKNKS